MPWHRANVSTRVWKDGTHAVLCRVKDAGALLLFDKGRVVLKLNREHHPKLVLAEGFEAVQRLESRLGHSYSEEMGMDLLLEDSLPARL